MHCVLCVLLVLPACMHTTIITVMNWASWTIPCSAGAARYAAHAPQPERKPQTLTLVHAYILEESNYPLTRVSAQFFGKSTLQRIGRNKNWQTVCVVHGNRRALHQALIAPPPPRTK